MLRIERRGVLTPLCKPPLLPLDFFFSSLFIPISITPPCHAKINKKNNTYLFMAGQNKSGWYHQCSQSRLGLVLSTGISASNIPPRAEAH
mgnify:CR=1 FL=1